MLQALNHVIGMAQPNGPCWEVKRHNLMSMCTKALLVGDVSTTLPNILTFRLASYNVFVVVVCRPPKTLTGIMNLYPNFCRTSVLIKRLF